MLLKIEKYLSDKQFQQIQYSMHTIKEYIIEIYNQYKVTKTIAKDTVSKLTNPSMYFTP